MSSSYSSDLRLQLLGAGDQAGTWGATTNNNFQYIIEQAIAGYQSVSIPNTGNVTLTYVNGATSTLANNQAICAALQLTGTPSAGFTVFTPYGASKVYIIANSTAQTATISVTGGTATVNIPANVTTTVYTDGVNFYSGASGSTGAFIANGAITASSFTGAGTGLTGTASALSIGGNAATATTATNLSGTLAIANGGTGSTTAAGALTNLGVLQSVYPVGSIYMNASNSTSPATLFGFGTWTALAAGRMLLGNGGGYTAGGTGGSSTTALSTTNLPSHTHGSSGLSASSSSNSSASTSVNISDPGHNHTYTFKTTTGGTLAGGDPNSVGNVTVNTGNAVTGISASASTSVTTNTSTSISGSTDATGSGSAFTTISPYLVVYMWQRTA